MRKRNIKLGAMLLAGCLSVAIPLIMPVSFTSYAAGSTVATTVDITPPASTADVGDYVKTMIQNALASNNTVVVRGYAEIDDPLAQSIVLDMQPGKKIIWEATLKSKSNNPMLILFSSTAGAQADFELAGGSLISEINVVLLVNNNNKIKLSIKDGEIIKSSNNDVPAVFLRGEGGLKMTGGRIINYAPTNSALLLDPSGPATFNIKGGTLFAIGDAAGTDLKTGNSVISINDATSDTAQVNIDPLKTNIIAWDRYTYNSGNPVIKYVGKGYDSRHLHKYPNSATKLSWTNVNGSAAIKYENPKGDSGVIMQEGAAVEDINFPALPTGQVYDKTGKGFEDFQAPDNSPVSFIYEGINGTAYPASDEKPTNAGDYKVSAKLSAAYGDLDIGLGTFKINKRPITIKVQDQGMIKGTELPKVPKSFEDFSIDNLANGDSNQDALAAVPAFTWKTNGRVEGDFPITVSSPVVYKSNYMAAGTKLKGTLKVRSNSSDLGKATPSNPKKRSGGNGSGSSGGSSSRNNGFGVVKKTGSGTWMQDAKGWWYKESDGSYPKSKWMELSYNNINRWYYFDEEGYMATGWKFINGKWYYLYENTQDSAIKGAMANNTKINGYYVGNDGAWVE